MKAFAKTSAAHFFFILCLMLTLAVGSATFAQDKDNYEADRQRAFQLIEQNNLIDALPVLEKLSAAKPDDTRVLQYLAFALAASAATKKDPEQIKTDFRRARQLAEKCKQLGDNSDLVQTLLEKIPADGNVVATPGKPRTPADEALHEGEAAFAKGDLDKALASYEKAEKLDPKLYEAPLFIGDVHFQMKKIDKAGEAYARAIAIDPDRDTAYRYWGNVLLSNDRMKEAREKLIEAVIAEPYSRTTWQFLARWGQRNQVQLSHPRVDIPTSVKQETPKDGKNQTNITLDMNLLGKKDGTSGWMFYGISRALWMNEKFLKEYPNEKNYRHSLREEMDALRGVIEAARNETKDSKDKSKLDPSIANLIKLHDAGLLEAFVVLAKPDAGSAQDYPEYRKNNRDKLRRYLNDYVTSGK
jgi:Tfp pilus assembly protein PilF